jgi:DNA-directed RNA polymerase subunit RPC12/RpoP
MSKARYIACPYCSSKKVIKLKVTNNLKECISERSYMRIKGALRQR